MKRPDRLIPLLAALCAALFLCSCGKKGPPVPQDQRSMFTWEETTAEFSGDCLILTGIVKGAYENVNAVSLELETVTEELCLDCPFKPNEFPTLTATSSQEGTLTFQYCPTNQADAYRWRLVGHNIYQYLPHALSPVKLARKPF